MELDKLKKWLDLAQQYQTENFWKQIFDEKTEYPSPSPLENPFTKVQEYIPKCDIYEEHGGLIAEIEIPGLNKEDIKVSINQQTLTISGEFKSLVPSRKYFLKERANHRFKKEIFLPFPVSLVNSSSVFNNGILVIHLPINQEENENVPILFDDQHLE
jgi:HSP20 family protein